MTDLHTNTNEVELSTEELSSFAAPKVDRPPDVVSAPVTKPPKTMASDDQRLVTPSKSLSTRVRWLGAHAYVVGAALVLMAAMAGVYSLQRDGAIAPQPALNWRPLPDRDPELFDEPVDERPPVRIRNEFDRSEVFEFPPGTTQQAARDQVEQILLQRAMARQRNTAVPPP